MCAQVRYGDPTLPRPSAGQPCYLEGMDTTDEAALLEEIRHYGMVSVSPEAIEVWFARSGWSLPEVVWASALGVLLVLLGTASPHDTMVLPLFHAMGVVVVLGLALAIWRSVGHAPDIHIDRATLRLGQASLPLEEVTEISAEGRRLRVRSGARRFLLRLPDADAAEPLVTLLERSVRRRKDSLRAEGHDIEQPARVPAALAALRER